MADDSEESARPATDAAALAAAAEAEALAAEALAAAARARVRAIRLRQQADSLAEADEADAPAADGEPPQRRPRRPHWPTVLVTASMLLVFALLWASGYIVLQHHDAVQHQQRAAAFTAAAKQGVINMTSLDFQRKPGWSARER